MIVLSVKSKVLSEGTQAVIRDVEGMELIRMNVDWLDEKVGKASFQGLTLPFEFLLRNQSEVISNAVPSMQG